MKVYRKELEYTSGQTFRIVQISDLHFTARACDETAFIATIKRETEIPNTFFAFGGDQQNCISVRDPRYTFGELHPRYLSDEDYLDRGCCDLADLITPVIKPEQILWFTEGNHEWENKIRTNQNLHARLAKMLGVEHSPMEFMYQLYFTHKSGGASRILTSYVHHGWGGPAPKNQPVPSRYIAKMDDVEADLYFFSHTHSKGSTESPKEYPKTNGTPGSFVKMRYVLVGGTFMKTGSNDENVTYPQRKGMPLRAIGNMTVECTVRSDKPTLDIKMIG